MSTPSEVPVEIRGLSKTYRVGFWLARKIKALEGLDLTIQAGQVYGLLGPNGAGKSTTIKILMNLVKASSGTATIFGKSSSDTEVRRLIGFVPENPAPYSYLTGKEFVTLAGRLAGLSGQDLDRRVNEVLGQVDMSRTGGLQIRRYSKGMVQRVALAQALIANPRLLVLDEPTSGLDPLGRRQMRDLILAQREKGTTILFCTHIIPDVEALCDRVAVLTGGKRVMEGRVQELLSGQDARVEVTVEGLDEAKVRELMPRIETLQQIDRRLLITVSEADAQVLLASVMQHQGRVTRLQPTRFGLEELFLSALKAAGKGVGAEISE